MELLIVKDEEEQCVVLKNEVSVEKSKRHPRWTREETMILIQAKDITENNTSSYKGRKLCFPTSSENNNSDTNSSSSNRNEPKWVMVSEYCKKQGVVRGPAQCRKRWSNLIGDYRKIKYWEDGAKRNGVESFWVMRNDLRKERRLPVSFDLEVFKVMIGRELGEGFGIGVGVGVEAAASPVPLRAVPSVAVEEKAAAEEEKEEEAEAEGEGEGDEKIVNDDGGKSLGEDNVEKVLELGGTSTGSVLENQSVEKRAEPNSDGLKESWPGISYWESQKAKRRRVSTDDPKQNNIEAEMMRVLEENNKMVSAQLEIHNNNVQLDRQQRKESTEVLVAALGNLTNVLVKIAEKL